MEQAPQMRGQQVRNVQTQHEDTTGMGFSGGQTRARKANQPDKPARTPVYIEKKIGRNKKITMVSPSGKKVMIKHKKLQQYLNQGYTEV
jgi:hypothetical protein